MCCNNCCNSYVANNSCSCYGSQNSEYGNSGGNSRNLNFIVSARVTPFNPCYINPYTGCAVPYATSSCGCGGSSMQSNNGCGCGCGCRHNCGCGWN